MSRTWFPPLAPRVTPRGTRFRLVSAGARRLLLQIYADRRDAQPARTLRLEAERHRRGRLWEILVPGTGEGTLYTWAVDGERPLVDPCALAVAGPERFGSDDPERPRPPLPEVNREASRKGVVVAPPPEAAWDRPRTPWEETVLYELPVRGFTRDPSSRVGEPGTYRGLVERIPYLRELGVNAVELLPVHEFDEMELRRGTGLVNVWGYSPIAWFAPNRRYAADAARLDGPIREFRSMVRAFHAAGIRVIVDVVFNHTAELDEEGPTWNFRDLDDARYYLHDAGTGAYANLTGCGNTVRAAHPATRALILQALRWWRHGLGVDGFRFDLATILSLDRAGRLAERPALPRLIETDPLLEGAVLIAEPWDAAGHYQVPGWPGGPRWAVWNDRFRDDVRRAWLGAPGDARHLATRLCGSSDLFRTGPPRSVNYVTAHDGFTLLDVVSYARKHNEANGEHGRDGRDDEVSANHGVEGPSTDPAVTRARERARRNLLASLLLAQGVPMLTAGDELGRTQLGNNNAYCHDGPLTWVDWTAECREPAFLRFVQGLVRLRSTRAALRRRAFLEGGPADGPDVLWFGPAGEPVDWDRRPGTFGYRLNGACARTGGSADEPDLLVLINLRDDPATFRLPPDRTGRRAWRLLVDTAALPPDDLHACAEAPRVGAPMLPVAPCSLAILTGEEDS